MEWIIQSQKMKLIHDFFFQHGHVSAGDIFGCVFVRGIMDFRGAWRSADVRILAVFGLLHHVCGVDHSHSRSSNWTVVGLV